MKPEFIQSMVHGFLVCMLWAESGDPESPLGASADMTELAPQTRTAAHEMCESFAHYCKAQRINLQTVRGMGPESIGHDLWLTSQGHGAGFWDRGLGAIGQRLTDAAKIIGSHDAYKGDDGLIYLSGYETHKPDIHVTLRRDPETGRPVLFYANNNPRGYWVECFTHGEGHNQVSREWMRRCTLIRPVTGRMPADCEALISAFETAGPPWGHMRAVPVSRLPYPAGLQYIGG